MVTNNLSVLRFVYRILDESIQRHISEMEKLGSQMSEIGLDYSQFQGLQPESNDPYPPLFCDLCHQELFIYYFSTYRSSQKRQDGTFFCQPCIIKRLKKCKSLYPEHCQGFIRYKLPALNYLLRKLEARTQDRSNSQLTVADESLLDQR